MWSADATGISNGELKLPSHVVTAIDEFDSVHLQWRIETYAVSYDLVMAPQYIGSHLQWRIETRLFSLSCIPAVWPASPMEN